MTILIIHKSVLTHTPKV